jgi:sRNA-binding regulator protein Hfq
MSSDSMVYTIGTALNRAHDNDVPVQLLVEGQWLSGHVLAVDGFGVVLHSDELEHAVVRMESVAAVRVLSPAPGRRPIGAGATPMPSPRGAWD